MHGAGMASRTPGRARGGRHPRWMVCEPNHFAVSWRIPDHAHAAAHELVLVVSGRLYTRIGGRAYIAGPGTAVLHPAGVHHGESALGGRPLRTLYLGWESREAAELRGLPFQLRDSDGQIELGLRWLQRLVARGTTAARAAADGVLCALLDEVRQRAVRPQDRLLEAVAAAIDRDLRKPLALDDLARAAELSRAHFARAFHAAAGITPMAFLRHRRMQRARELLLTTDLPLADVADQVGYPDRFHFSRVFRASCGSPPGRLRRQLRGAAQPATGNG